MIGDLLRLPAAVLEEVLDTVNVGLWYLDNKQTIDEYLKLLAECDDCEYRQPCPEHLEVAWEVFFTDA